MIRFTNLNKSPMTAYSPRWQEDIIKRVNEDEEYQKLAIETSEKIRQKFLALTPRIQTGYYATAFEGVMREVPRYVYIKNVKDGQGREYDAQIDLALHTVLFIEVKE